MMLKDTYTIHEVFDVLERNGIPSASLAEFKTIVASMSIRDATVALPREKAAMWVADCALKLLRVGPAGCRGNAEEWVQELQSFRRALAEIYPEGGPPPGGAA